MISPDSKKYVFLLMAGHIVTDINQGALPAILPFLVIYYDFSYAAAGGLVLACNSVSSVIQPLLGYVSDRFANPVIMAIGIILAGLGIALVGIVGSYWLMFLSVVVSGFGVALFHPEGGRMVNCVAKVKKGEAMGIFSVGGSIGFAVGPLLVVVLVPFFGLKSLLFFVVPPILMAVLLGLNQRQLKAFSDSEYHARTHQDAGAQKENWRGFGILAAVLFGGSITSYALFAFVPLFLVGVLGQTESRSITMLTLMAAMCAISAYVGGRLSDRYGFRRIIIIGSILYIPLALWLACATNFGMAAIIVILLGLVMRLYQSPSVSLGQQFLSNHVGLASGITLGLAVSVGGMAAPLLGWLGDHHGLRSVFLTIAAVGAVAAVIAFFIPKKPRPEITLPSKNLGEYEPAAEKIESNS